MPSVGGLGTRQVGAKSSLVLGGAMGGLAMGVSAGIVGWTLALAGATGAATGLVILAYLLVVIPPLRRLAPERRRQVIAATARQHAPSGAALRWGFTLGVGFRTYVVNATLYVLITGCVALGQPVAAALIGAAYGAARAGTIAFFAELCERGMACRFIDGRGLGKWIEVAAFGWATTAVFLILSSVPAPT